MSKAVLILDEMPESCSECRLFNVCDDGKSYYQHKGRYPYCPLQPLGNLIDADLLLEKIRELDTDETRGHEVENLIKIAMSIRSRSIIGIIKELAERSAV